MPSPTTTDEISLGSVAAVLRRRRGTVIFFTLLVTAAAAIFAFLQANKYRAEVLISAQPAAAQDYLQPSYEQPPINVQDRLWLIRENLFRPDVLDQVNQEFHLAPGDASPTGMWGRIAQRTAQWAGKGLSAIGLPLGPGLTEAEKKERQEDLLKSKIRIQVEAADAFSVSLEGKNRQQVTDAANRMAELLVQHTSTASEQRAGTAAGFLQAEVARVRQQMGQQQARIENFQGSATDRLPERLDDNLKQLEELQDQLLAKQDQIADDQAHRAAVSAEMRQLEAQGVSAAPELAPADSTHLAELQAHLKDLLTVYTPEYPEVQETEAEIASMEKAAPANLAKARTEPSPLQLHYMQLKAELQEVDGRIASHQKEAQALGPQIAAYQRKVQATPQDEQTLADLTHDYEATRAQYQSLLDKQYQAQIEERLDQTAQSSLFRVVRPAELPVEPSEPKRGRIVLIGLLGGLCLGLGMALVRDSQDTSCKTVEDFRVMSNLPVLAAIPVLPGRSKEASERAIIPKGSQNQDVLTLRLAASDPVEQAVTLSEPRSIAAEQYGFLAMELRQVLGHGSKVVALTSAAGGEGKTITSINLSVMLARTRPERVLLLECDLRKPRVHAYLGIQPSPAHNLSDLLRDPDQPLEPCLYHVGPLCVIPSDSPIPNPLETLASDRVRRLFDHLRREFQFIVVDLPPILPIADSRIVANLADGVIVVVRAQQTRRDLFQHALERFNAPNVLGVVLNGVEVQRTPYANAYSYYAREYLGQGAKRAS